MVAKVGSNERPGQKLAVVVGAGGMGMAVARRLGQSHRLLLVDRDGDHLQRQIAALHLEGYVAAPAVCNVADAAAVSDIAATVAQHGGFRTLVHVVGLSPSMGDWTTIMTVNLIGATLVADALLPHATAEAAAVFISSLAGHTVSPSADVLRLLDSPLAPDFLDNLRGSLNEPATPALAYQHSKHGLTRMCSRRAALWGRQGARIVSVSPGLIATPMGALEFERQPMKYDLLAATPLQREGTMIEIADAVEFLASDRASFITGIDLLIDGGLMAAQRAGRA
jgi:NAD(P)-dependent dehydrogenase (short-subunit alcohol dehydrogenase family)